MTVKSVSQDWYNNLVTNYGEDYANDFIARYKLEIIPTVGQFKPVRPGALNTEGGDPPMDDVDENDADGADEQTSGLPSNSLTVNKGRDAYADWETRQSQYLKELSAQRQRQLADAKAYIEKNYRGPSLSEQLFAISQALLTPTRMSGFKGTLASLAPAFSSIAKAQTESNRQRAEALFKLQQQYEKGVMDERGDVLKNELALLKARNSGSPFIYAPDRGGYIPKAGHPSNAPMPEMDEYGNYVITDPRQLTYLPPNTPIILPGGDPLAPKYTKAGTTR